MEETKSTPPSPQNPSASGAAAVKNNTPMLMGIAAIVTVVVVAVIVGVLILLNRPSTTGADINTANPQEATAQLNSVLEETVIAFASGENEKAAQKLAAFAALDKAKVAMSLKVAEGSGNINLSFDGKVGTQDSAPVMEGTLKLSGTIPDSPLVFTTPAELDMVVTKDKVYLRVRNLPAEIQALMTQLGVSSNTWYFLDNESAASTGQAFSGNVLDADQLAELKQKLATNDIFINPRATADRTVDGVNTKCMLVEGNPALGEGNNASADKTPLEICSADNALLPLFLGVKDEQNGTNTEVGFSVNKLDGNFSVTAPAGATDLEPILQRSLGGLQ